MLAHLSQSARMALGELPVKSQGKRAFRVFPLKHLILYVFPFPKSAPTARELLAGPPAAGGGREARARRPPGAPRPRAPGGSRSHAPALRTAVVAGVGRARLQALGPPPAPVRGLRAWSPREETKGEWNGQDDSPHRSAEARRDRAGGDAARGRQRLRPGAAAAPYAITAIDTAHGDREFHLLWPGRGAGGGRQRAGRQAEDHRLPGSRRPGDRRRRRRLPGRRLPGGGRRPRGQADRRVAELARRQRLRPAVPARPALPAPGAAAGRAAGDPHGPQPGEGVGRRPEADRDPRLLGGRAPGLDRGHALRRREGPTPPTRSSARARGPTSPSSATPSSPSSTRRPTRARAATCSATPRTRRSSSCSATRSR